MKVRVKLQNDFTTFKTSAVQSLQTAEAMGVYCFLLSKSDNWEVRASFLEKRFGFKTYKRRKIFKELERYGLAKLFKGGPGGGAAWVITNVAFQFGEEEESAPASQEMAPEDVGQSPGLEAETPQPEEEKRPFKNHTPAPEKEVRPFKNSTVGFLNPLLKYRSKNESKSEEGVKEKDNTHTGGEIDYETEALNHIKGAILAAPRAVKESWKQKHGAKVAQSGKTALELATEAAENILAKDPVFSIREGEDLLYYVKQRANRCYQIYFQNKWLPNVRPMKGQRPAAFSSFDSSRYAQGA
jgi:hypothetical protein